MEIDLLETLKVEIARAYPDGGEMEQTPLANGEWAPRTLAREDDEREVQGLVDRTVFWIIGDQIPGTGTFLAKRCDDEKQV